MKKVEARIRKLVFLLILLTFFFILLVSKIVLAEVEKAKVYTVSRSDMNRIICPSMVTDVILSEEKDVATKIVGKDIFVKFPVSIVIDQDTGERTVSYGTEVAEMFVVCGDKTYTILLKPVNIPAQTIELEPELELAVEMKGKDNEENLGILVSLAIGHEMPKSFKKEELNSSYRIKRGNNDINVLLRWVYRGSGYKVMEYHIYSKELITLEAMELASFPEVVKPLALSLTHERFKGWTRGFVVEGAN